MVKYGDMVLMIRVIVGETITPDGKKVYQARWMKAEEDVNIGSLNNQLNKDIIEFKWVKPNPLAGLF